MRNAKVECVKILNQMEFKRASYFDIMLEQVAKCTDDPKVIKHFCSEF